MYMFNTPHTAQQQTDIALGLASIFHWSSDAVVSDYDSVIRVRMHYYDQEVGKMCDYLSKDYNLVSVFHVQHAMCSESGREFWWQKKVTSVEV